MTLAYYIILVLPPQLATGATLQSGRELQTTEATIDRHASHSVDQCCSLLQKKIFLAPKSSLLVCGWHFCRQTGQE